MKPRLSQAIAIAGFALAAGWGASARAEDAYLESTGTQAINSGYYIHGKTKIEIDFQLTAIVAQCRLFGQYGNNCGNCAVIYLGDDVNNFKIGYGNNTFSGVYLAANNLARNTIVYDGPRNKAHLVQNGVTNATATLTAAHEGQGTWPMAIFAESDNVWGNTFKNWAKMKLYSLKVYEDDALVREYVPCLEEGVAGLYETVEQKFYFDPRQTHTTAMDFKYGGDIMTKEDDAYIQADGTAVNNPAVNTRFFACPDMHVEMDLRLTSEPEDVYRFLGGDYTASGEPGMAFYMSGAKTLSFCHFAGGHSGDSGVNVYRGPGYTADTLRHRMSFDMTCSPARDWFITSYATNYYYTLNSTNFIDKTATRPIGIFGSFTAASAGSCAGDAKWKGKSVKVYRVKMWKGGELKHDYVPRVVDGIPGFRDLVDGVFATCEGLTYGGKIIEEKGDAYVESVDRGRFFDTGYKITPDTRIDADYAFIKHDNAPQQFVFEGGSEKVVRAYTSGSKTNDSVNSWSFQDGTGNYTGSGVNLAANVRRFYTLDGYNKKVALSTEGYTNYTATMTTTNVKTNSLTTKLFSNAWGNNNFAIMRLYGFKIYEKGELVHDFEPICDGGEGKLQDRVTGTILQSGNSKKFTCGGNIRTLGGMLDGKFRAEDAYIESDGTQAILLDYHTQANTRYEIDYQLTKITGQDRAFGAAAGGTAGGLSAELYIQGSSDGSGNVAVGVGDSWTGQYTNMNSDKNRHGAIIDCNGMEWGYTGYGTAKITSACTGTGKFPMAIFAKSTSVGGALSNFARMKLYAFRIYEGDKLIHQYLPYKNGSVIGLYDTVTSKEVLNTKSGANAFVYGGDGYGKYDGNPVPLLVKPEGATLHAGDTTTLSAYAPGAVAYRWTKNGETLAGETGKTLTVAWEKLKTPRLNVYAVAPVFQMANGTEAVGEAAVATVENAPMGMTLLVR